MKVRLPSIGLFERIFLMIVVGLVVMLGGFIMLGVQALNDSTERTLEERRTLAQVIAGRVDDRLNDSIQMIQVMLETQKLEPDVDSLNAQTRWAEDMHMHMGDFANWVAVTNKDRELTTVYPRVYDALNFDFVNAKCIQYVYENSRPVISCAFRLGSDIPTVAMVVPIFKDGRYNGAVFAALNLNSPHFTEILKPLGLGGNSFVEVIDSNGLILGSTRPELLWQQDDHQGQIAVLIQRKTTTVGTCHSCHVEDNTIPRREDVMAFAPLASAKWGVALRQSREEAFSYSDQLRQRAILLGVATFLIAVMVTWLLTRQWVGPLQSLTGACQEIAAGNLDAAIPLKGVGEIGALAHAFDLMRQELRTSLAKIRGWTAELEARVYQRTQELEESREQVLEANRELSTLNAIGSVLRQSVDLETTLDFALESMVSLEHVWGASICLLNKTGTQLIAQPHHSIHLNGQCACEWEPIRTSISQVLQNKQTHVFLVPLVLTAEDKIEMKPEVPMHPVVCVPLVGKNRNLGLLILINPRGQSFTASELNLLTSIGTQIGIAVENALLFDELREKEESRTELLRKVIAAQEEERQRIARELHDETSQAITAMNVGLKTAIMAPAETPEDVKRRLIPLKTQAAGMLQEIQRMIFDLRPSLLDDLGLISAIDSYAKARLKAQGIQVEWEIVGQERRLPRELETTLFRVAQEAISNIARHAQAEYVSIVLGFENHVVTLDIEDDGKGFVFEGSSSIRPNGNYGLLGMRERVHLLGGELTIESQFGQGTHIQARIPVLDENFVHAESRQNNS